MSSADFDGLLLIVNCLTHAGVLLENHLQTLQGGSLEVTSSTSAMGLLLQRELGLVVEHARTFAGLNPDGTFDQVPAPATSTSGVLRSPPARSVRRRSADPRLTKSPAAKKGGRP